MREIVRDDPRFTVGWMRSGTLARVPLAGRAVSGAVSAAMSRGGDVTGQCPSADERAGARTLVVARTLDPVGRRLSHVTLEGPSPYDLTAELLAWGAAVGLAAMFALIRRAFGAKDGALEAWAVLFACHTVGYTIGDELHAAFRGATGRVLWGTAYGAGFGAGLGYLLAVAQRR